MSFFRLLRSSSSSTIVRSNFNVGPINRCSFRQTQFHFQRPYHVGTFTAQRELFQPKDRKVSIIGCPLSLGQMKIGVQKGPEVIRKGGLYAKILKKTEWQFEDIGDLELPEHEGKSEENAHHSEAVGLANKLLHEVTYQNAKKNRFCLSLGGDHSIGIGSVSGILKARPETALIWMDAHADINTPKTSLTGNIHGMSVGFLLGLDNTRSVYGFEWMKDVPHLLTTRVAYIGIRDLDPAEKKIIKELGIRALTMQDVDRYGIGKVMEMTMDHLCGRVQRPLHFSLDIDSVDPSYAPSTGTIVRGGLTYREAFYVTEYLAETGYLGSMDMVEVNPQLDSPEGVKATVDMAIGLIAAALGDRIL